MQRLGYMADRNALLCRYARCPHLVMDKSGYCTMHKDKGVTHKRREKVSHALYHTRRWIDYSRMFRRNNPLCINFEQCRGEAQLVDHIKAVEQGGTFWDERNHQPMCHSCHNKKRAKEKYIKA
jgi:5-methylcytosine-specific restriction endonuclease McrA